MKWKLSNRFDPAAAAIADRHYSRQKIGSPQFVPPGRCMVLTAGHPARALWVTSWQFARFTKHEWAGMWVCSIFRNEGAGLSSDLIIQAVAATRWYSDHGPLSWRGATAPSGGMITFVKPSAIKSRNPGYCFKKAGFRLVGQTKMQRLPALQLRLSDMPQPIQPIGSTRPLF